MKVKYTPIASAVAIALLTIAGAASAQEATKAAAAPASAASAAAAANELDKVVVTGIRASLQSATNIKKSASAVVDAVSAEDIGKLPDSDVGQSLGRIPGVTVGRAFGQGSSVSIRGTDPQMTYTTLNGQSVASTGWYDQMDVDRSFNYSLLPSELVGGMEVYKSSQADLTEGGIGGTVIVKTRKPLDLAANTIFASAKLGKGSISDLEKELSGLYSWRDSSRKFGALVAAGVSGGDYIRNGIEADSRWASDVAPTAFVQERKRTALNVALQAKPVDGLEVGFNVLKLKLGGNNSNSSDYIFHDANCTKRNTDVKSDFNPNGVCLSSNTTAANPLQNQFYQNWAREADMKSDSYTLDAHYRTGFGKFDFVVGKTTAEGGTSLTTNYAYGWWGKPAKWQGTIDATGKQISLNPTSNQSFGLDKMPAESAPEGWATSQGPNKDSENYAQLDATFNLNWGAISSFKTGARLANHTFEKRALRPIWKDIDSATDGVQFTPTQTAGLFDGSVDVASWSVPRPNIGAMVANTRANILGWNEDRAAYSELNEKNRAVYGMFDFDAQNVRGNFGLRYISTKVQNKGYTFDGTPLAAGDYAGNINWGKSITVNQDSYNDLLPSMNLAFDLSSKVILRASASQAITRPNFSNMFGVSVSGYNDDRRGNETWTVGSVSLKPMKSSQADLGVEYYYGKGNLLSATLFTKDVANFITADVKTNQQVGLVDPLTGVDNWTVQSYVNTGGGRLRGIELQANHSFDNGFGVATNYTYTDATAPASSYLDKLSVFTQSSKHAANLVGYYENQTLSARLAYNYRSEYMIRENAFWYGNRMHDATGTLDASFSWNITKHFTLSLEGINLLAQDDVQYGAAAASNTSVKDPLRAGFPAWSFKGERTFKLGLAAKF